jgi:hypothetical protein
MLKKVRNSGKNFSKKDQAFEWAINPQKQTTAPIPYLIKRTVHGNRMQAKHVYILWALDEATCKLRIHRILFNAY